jgi:hypothetical protein
LQFLQIPWYRGYCQLPLKLYSGAVVVRSCVSLNECVPFFSVSPHKQILWRTLL